jgi:hypothetical protein
MERERFIAFTVKEEQVSNPVAVFAWSLPLRVRVDAVRLVGLIRFNVETVSVEVTISVFKKAVVVCWVEKATVERCSVPLPVHVDVAVM